MHFNKCHIIWKKVIETASINSLTVQQTFVENIHGCRSIDCNTRDLFILICQWSFAFTGFVSNQLILARDGPNVEDILKIAGSIARKSAKLDAIFYPESRIYNATFVCAVCRHKQTGQYLAVVSSVYFLQVVVVNKE